NDGSLDGAPSEGTSAGSTSSAAPALGAPDGSGDPMAQLALCAAAKAKLHPVSEQQAQELKIAASQEEKVDVAQDLEDILFDVLVVEPQEDVSTNALKVLIELAMMYVKQTAFSVASEILERLRSLAANEQVEHGIRALVVEQLQSLGDPRRVEVLVETLKCDVTVNLNDLARFLKILPAPAAPGLCELMEIERYDEVIREAIAHLIREDPTVLTGHLAGPNVEMARKVLGILERVADASVGPALVDPLTSAETPVQLASVKLLAKIKGAPARELLLHYVAGEAPELRRHALETLGKFEAGGGPAVVLRQQVMSGDFHGRSLQEKKVLLVTLAKLEAHHAVEFLGMLVGETKWFEKTHHVESRACAALALGEIPGGAARALLEKHASDKHETVRTAVKVALSRAPDAVAVGVPS
ncbi:MAG TPA: hypothetical protein VMY39_03870, partial [Planctomycetota bacterium]|nr:hypothetical protein [Planctomycetota bacterium]